MYHSPHDNGNAEDGDGIFIINVKCTQVPRRRECECCGNPVEVGDHTKCGFVVVNGRIEPTRSNAEIRYHSCPYC